MLQPKKPIKKTKKSTNPADSYPPMKDKRGVPTIGGGEGTTPPFTRKEMEYKKKMTGLPRGKMGKTVSKAKNGTSLGMKSVKAGFDKNPGVTRADIITAATKKAKKGATVKKAFLGKMLGGAGKSMIGGLAGKALGGLMGGGGKSGGIGGMLGGLMGKNGKSVNKAKSGGSMKKCKGGC
jgi:hypothetical protein